MATSSDTHVNRAAGPGLPRLFGIIIVRSAPAGQRGLSECRCRHPKPRSAWWRRRELNPRPKQSPTGSLRACPGFWFSLGGSSWRDPLFASRGGCPASGPWRPRSGNPVSFDAVPQSAGL